MAWYSKQVIPRALIQTEMLTVATFRPGELTSFVDREHIVRTHRDVVRVLALYSPQRCLRHK
jgi:hypothetical protein